MQQPDDLLVIQDILQGQQSAYAILVNKYQSYVFTLVLRYVADRGLAEELAQDVFVKAYRCLADFKGSSKFSTWLYTIVHTTCLSQLRKKKDETMWLEESGLRDVTAQMHGDRVETVIEGRSQKLLISRALTHLPPDDAQIITLFYGAEQSLEEIARILGITCNNAKVKLHRARQRLREVLQTKFTAELA
jgi:RNA polymerase sigma-70 factor (ECF subfamily)